jgi:predicted  nucleic acid-binding Zn-ribbon protein
VIAGGGLAGGAALDAPALGVLGVGVYALLVARDVLSPAFWRRSLSGPATAATLPSPRRIRDARLREATDAVVRARTELDRVVATASADVAAHVDGMSQGIDDLTSRASRLVATGESISKVLAHRNPKALHREVDRLRTRLAQARDPATAQGWREALAGREEHLQVALELQSGLERIEANLVRIAAALDALAAKVVRMGALDAEAMGNLSGDMSSELSRLSTDVNAFEETLRHLVAVEARA